MKEIKDVLNLTDCENMEKQFRDMAETLMKNWCIKQGDVTYQFLEIEFYYFSKNHKDLHKDKVDSKTGSPLPFVYQRNSPKEGVFLLHDSGVDICFKGKVDSIGSDESCGGGLLIRTLRRIEGKDESIVTGPWDCRDALFNYIDHETAPELVCKEDSFKVKVDFAKRFNDKSKEPFASRLYCAYVVPKDTTVNNWGQKRYDPLRMKVEKDNYNAVPWNRK